MQKKKKRGEKYAEWKGQNVWCVFIITILQSYIQTFCAGRVCPQKCQSPLLVRVVAWLDTSFSGNTYEAIT